MADLRAVLEALERADRDVAGSHRLQFGTWPSGTHVLFSARSVYDLFLAVWNGRRDLIALLRRETGR